MAMRLTGNGLFGGSEMFFSTPSQTARQLLFYPTAVGEFHCAADYRVERERYDSFLLLYVVDGFMTLEQDGETVRAGKNEALFVDCYRPHLYYTGTCAHILWLHFDGVGCRAWYDGLRSRCGAKLPGGRNTAERLRLICRHTASGDSEYGLAQEIYALLCELAGAPETAKQKRNAAQIDAAVAYINDHYPEPLTVNELAKTACLSAPYFTRAFKEATGLSPYDYLLNVRLDRAKELLITTRLSVGEIALHTGFRDTSNFISCFRKKVGISPLKFRHLSF